MDTYDSFCPLPGAMLWPTQSHGSRRSRIHLACLPYLRREPAHKLRRLAMSGKNSNCSLNSAKPLTRLSLPNWQIRQILSASEPCSIVPPANTQEASVLSFCTCSFPPVAKSLRSTSKPSDVLVVTLFQKAVETRVLLDFGRSPFLDALQADVSNDPFGKRGHSSRIMRVSMHCTQWLQVCCWCRLK
jgi:hypothetical protein